MVKLAAVEAAHSGNPRLSWTAVLRRTVGTRVGVLTADGQLVHGRIADLAFDLVTVDAGPGTMHLPLHAVTGLQTGQRLAAHPSMVRTAVPSVPHEIEQLVGRRVLCVAGSHRLTGELLDVGVDCVAISGPDTDVRWVPWRALDHLSVQRQEVVRRAAGF